MSRHLPHISYRVFTVLVVVSLPLLALATALVLGVGQAELRDSYGVQLTQVAEHTAATVDAYVYRRIIDAQILTRVPAIREVAEAGNAQPFDAQKVRAIDQAWVRDRGAEAQLLGTLENPASKFLRDITDNDRIYREILVTDRYGRLVAASNPTTDYDQADEDWWRTAYDDGVRGRVHVTDVMWDDSARTFAVEIAIPIISRPGEPFTGILKVVGDARELLASVGSLQVGTTGEAMLIRQDASVVYSRGTTGTKATFFAADLLRELLSADRGGDPQYRLHFSALNRDGRSWAVGIAPSQLGTSYPNLNWLVAVTQSEDELFAPVRAQLWHLLAVLGLMATVVLALAAWFSARLAAPSIEPEMHIFEHPGSSSPQESSV